MPASLWGKLPVQQDAPVPVAPHRGEPEWDGVSGTAEELQPPPNSSRKSETGSGEKRVSFSFSSLPDLYGDAWRAIIRPPRDTYPEDALGPEEFSLRDRTYQRHELDLRNAKGQKLVCSHFQPAPAQRSQRMLPCVIYLHGNCSSRVEALATLPVLLPLGITVFCFDFAGSGRSDGDYVSLGYHERDDLATVVGHLRDSGSVGAIGVWGRSMGAVTALLHSHRDPTLAGIVLDSPFASLPQLALELVDKHCTLPLPRWLVSGVLGLLRSSIQQRADFDLYDVDPLKVVPTAFIPALFTAASSDVFIVPSHAKQLYDAYAGDKNMVMVDGDHNSARPRFLLDSIAIFFIQTLQVDLDQATASPSRPPGSARSRASRARKSDGGSTRRAEREDDRGPVADLARRADRAARDAAPLLDADEAATDPRGKAVLIEC